MVGGDGGDGYEGAAVKRGLLMALVVGKIAVENIRVGARVPLGVGGVLGALRLVGRGMLAMRCVHKAGRRDGRCDMMVVVVVVKWYRYWS